MTISLLTLEVEGDCNDFWRGCWGAFHYRAEQRCSTPAGKCEVEIDMEYSILVN